MTFFSMKNCLEQFSLLFCPIKEKWVTEDTCIWCNCTRYPNDFRCNVWHDRGKYFESNKSRPGDVRCWTLEQIVEMMKTEEMRVKKINEEHRQVQP